MTKRLKYTKDILTHMLNNNQPNPVSGAAASTDSTNGLSTQGAALQMNSNSSRRGAPMASAGIGHNGISSAISTGGISGNDLPMNGLFNMGGPGVNTITGSNQGQSTGNLQGMMSSV